MEKTGELKIGSPCTYCSNPSTQEVENLHVCDFHATAKKAMASGQLLKSAEFKNCCKSGKCEPKDS